LGVERVEAAAGRQREAGGLETEGGGGRRRGSREEVDG